MFSHSRLPWYRTTGSILAWWKVAVHPPSLPSLMCTSDVLWWASLCLLGSYLPLKSAAITTIIAAVAATAAVAYWAPIFTFHFSPSHSGRKLSGRCCDEITMSFCLRKELQNAGMKEAGLMGEMITCQWCKRRWSSERELEKDGFLFLLWDHLKLPGLSFYFQMKCWVSSLMAWPWVGLGLPEAY